MATTDEVPPPRGDVLGNVVSGVGLGLLLGLIVGLSKTPVVAEVVGALTGLLAVFLGLQSGGNGAFPGIGRLRVNALRIGSFGLAAAVGLLIGLFLRVTEPFAQSPEQALARWSAAFPDNTVLARQAMIYERTGVRPKAWTFEPGKASEAVWDEGVADARQGVLFGVLRRANPCDDLNPADFGGDPTETLVAYDNQGEAVLDRMAEQVRALERSEQAVALNAMHALFCALRDDLREGSRGND